MPRETGSGVPKKHISTACTPCRNRKVKCNGQTPTCSNCMLYNQRCEYNHCDKRRLSHKKTIQSLTERVALLESILISYGIEIPSASTPESQLSTVDGPLDHHEKERLNDQAGDCYIAQTDFNQHAFNPKLTNEIQFQKSFESLFKTGEISNFLPDYKDVTDLFPPPVAHFPPVYDFDQTSVGSQDDIHSGQGAPTQNPNGCRTKLTAVASNKDSCVPISSFNIMDEKQHNDSARGGHKDRLMSVLNVSSRGNYADKDRQHDNDEIMDQLSARMGAFQIAEDGQLRYFGATSNLHILHNGLSSLSRPVNRSVRIEGEEVLSRAGLDHTVDRELQRQLEDLYFQWEDPAIHVVDEEMYFLAQNRYYSGEDGTPFYSETLKNAICAAGSSLTSRTDLGLPHETTEFFSSRAKLLLEIEMDSPSIATVQALVIMSATEAAFTRDARGWLYSGMAVRLSADLGLHLDLSSEVEQGTLSDRELEVRRTTFWGVFVHDNMWSLYLGRPWGINIQNISISRPPKELDKLRSRTWNRSSDPTNSISTAEKEGLGLYDPVYACADANVSLCVMMRQLSKTVYSDKTLSEIGLREFATSMRVELDEWQQALPAELKVDLYNENKFYLPHVLQLHMQFYAISILLHRPFFSHSLNTPNIHSEPESKHPRVLCITAAQSIVKLLRIYRKQHTLRRTNVHIVHLVFTASLICIYNTYSNQGSSAANSLNDLQFCCQALGEIGEAYQNSTRALEVVICIKREWLSKTRKLSRFKRPNPSHQNENTDDMRRKKRLTESQDDIAGIFGVMAGLPLGSDGELGQDKSGLSASLDSFLDTAFPASKDSHQLDPGFGQYGNPF